MVQFNFMKLREYFVFKENKIAILFYNLFSSMSVDACSGQNHDARLNHWCHVEIILIVCSEDGKRSYRFGTTLFSFAYGKYIMSFFIILIYLFVYMESQSNIRHLWKYFLLIFLIQDENNEYGMKTTKARFSCRVYIWRLESPAVFFSYTVESVIVCWLTKKCPLSLLLSFALSHTSAYVFLYM